MTTPRLAVESSTEHLAAGGFGDSPAILSDIDTLLDGLALVHRGVGFSVPADKGVARSLTRRALHAATRGQVSNCPVPQAASDALAAGSGLLSLIPTRSAQANVLVSLARSMLAKDGYPAQICDDSVILRATDQVAAALGQLQVLVPSLAAAALPHASLVIFMSGPFQSVYLADLPELIILNPQTIGDSAHLGELLLHESLHQKFYDIVLVRRISGSSQARVRCEIPWGPVAGGYRSMDPLRLLSTFHVYVHLAAYRLAADTVWCRPAPGSEAHVNSTFEEYIHRAEYFQHLVSASVVAEHLGQDAPTLVSWLNDARMSLTQLSQRWSRKSNQYMAFAEQQIVNMIATEHRR